MSVNSINLLPFSPDVLERDIDFTREQYEELRQELKKEMVDYDDFLYNVVEATQQNGGTYEDAVFTANDAFIRLQNSL